MKDVEMEEGENKGKGRKEDEKERRRARSKERVRNNPLSLLPSSLLSSLYFSSSVPLFPLPFALSLHPSLSPHFFPP